MAENKPSLLVAVKKFRQNFDINHAENAKISRGFRTLGVLDCIGCLTICNVSKKGCKALGHVLSFEWGCQANSRHDGEFPYSTPDDCLVVIKDDHSVEVHHVQLKETSDDMLDDLIVSCDVVVTADLLKSLLRDRGKDCSIQEVSIIAMATEHSPQMHTATLLINKKYITVMTLCKTEEPKVVSCFALDNSMPSLPIIVPVLSLVQVRRCHSLIFCLFSSGTALIHHVNGDFIACLDIQSYHYSKQDPDLEDVIDVQHFQRNFVHLEVTEDLSLLVSSDDSNNIYSVNLDDYFRENPDHLNVKDKTTRTKPVSRGMQYSVEDEDQLVRNSKMADIACGDRFWKNELLEMRTEAARNTSVTNGFPGSGSSQSTGRWFSSIKDLKLLDFSIQNKTTYTRTEEPSLKSQQSGFLLKRKKSESRSLTPSSESSCSMNKEPPLPKFSWAEAKSLFYQADQWMEEQKIVQLFAASDSLIVWFKQARSTEEPGNDCPFGLVCLFGYGSKEALYRHL